MYKNQLQLVYDSVEKLIPYCEKNEIIIKIGIDPNKLNGQIDLEKTTPQQQLKYQLQYKSRIRLPTKFVWYWMALHRFPLK